MPGLESGLKAVGCGLVFPRMHPAHHLCALLLFAAPLRAQEKISATHRDHGMTISLVSEVKAIHPGEAFWVGLHIQHEPKYHTYWKAPGIAGVPTRMEWALPAGWKTGPLIFPPPDKVKMAIYSTHGYERNVLLLAEITPPADLAAGEAVLAGKASWMCCADTCHPGFGQLSLTLPVRPGGAVETDAAWMEKFQATRDSQPLEIQGWKLKAVRQGTTVTVTGTPPPGLRMPEHPQFFSDDNLICSHPVQKWEAAADGSFSVALTVSEFPPKGVKTLSGLLFAPGGWHAKGTAPYVQIRVPLEGDGG